MPRSGWIAALLVAETLTILSWTQSDPGVRRSDCRRADRISPGDPRANGRPPPGNQRENQIAGSETSGYVGNDPAPGCHSAIYQSYSRTPMAQASGPAIENVIPSDFFHSKSGVHYRIYSEGNRAWLSFERPGDPEVRGKRELLYYIGSGRRGLSYLSAQDGFLFESPVNWYSHEQRWDMAPAYQDTRRDSP